ncbi:DUF2249 domain-containing protein [Saccharopolyspora dendranthemae]|uniref:Uncharacterized protein (DUF2249 family) n=1 Tax=Saccharopolyspora dendranthemae TaxID=1181886 RepID=A0A561V798_9PSEU|nr:DUF2249 domain-containing protein [Saccharopolyspora dendranthemae]TWG07486.1 uncharacterized protein (DUF2249 family) [Saccharopolyspora dendranthemae]
MPVELSPQPDQELDVRPLRKPDKHPTIFTTYASLPVGDGFVLINDHDPKHLRDEFEVEHPGSHRWDYLRREPGNWRIKITKLAAAPLPRVLLNTAEEVPDGGAAGAVWTLPFRERDLDSNIIALSANGRIDAHVGPDLDVLIHVLAGSGELETELDTVELSAGALVWLPRRSRRQFTAGPEGLRYLTVHQRRQALVLDVGLARGGGSTAADGQR